MSFFTANRRRRRVHPRMMPIMVCPNCGEENPERARFCLACGTALRAQDSAEQERRTVSILFCDVEGSTSIAERLDPESVRAVMADYFSGMTSVIERHGGTVEKFIGDAIMAVFGFPRLHEDDALRAVRAAAEMRQTLGPLNETLRRERDVSIAVRIGVNTGEVVLGDPSARQMLVTGDAVNVAARLEQAAGVGEVLIGQTTYRLIKDAVVAEGIEPLALKGKSDPVPAWKVERISAEGPGLLRRRRSALVGREREQRLLADTLGRVTREQRCHLFTIFGSAGVGKTRFVNEVIQGAGGDSRVLRGICLSYGEGVALRPLVEMISDAATIAPRDSLDRVAEKIARKVSSIGCEDSVARSLTRLFGSAGATASPEETFWAVRKLFEGLARLRPLALYFDDLHWGEPALLDLIDQVAEWSRDVPMLIVCAARPELLERRPDWGGGKLNAVSLQLSALTPEESHRLVENLAGGSDLTDDLKTKLVGVTAGQPLFIEEMVAMLADETDTGRDVRTLEARGAPLPVPETIHSLLAARIDQLPVEERHLLQAAAVIGVVFKLTFLEALATGSAEAINARLAAVCSKDLLREDSSRLGAGDSFSFRQSLMRDAAYQSIPKERRAELHERIAHELEREPPTPGVDIDDLLAHHLEAAYRCRTELRPGDEYARTLARKAIGHLASACTEAVVSLDAGRVHDLLQRALSLMAGTPFYSGHDGSQVASTLGRAAMMLGEWGSVITLLTPLVEGRSPEIWRDLGVALCKFNRNDTNGPGYRRGQHLLEDACAASPKNADALASLAGTWKGIDDSAAYALYRAAVEADPSDPYAVGNLLEYEISQRGDLSVVRRNLTMSGDVIARCRAQADARENLPWAFYDIGKFSVLLERGYESIAAYAKAVQLSTARFMIETSLQSLERLSLVAGEVLLDLGPARWFLQLATVADQTGVPFDGEGISAMSASEIKGPVTVIAGGTHPDVEERMSAYGDLLLGAFKRYEGTVISGGTASGVSGLAGNLGASYPDAIRTIGYVPVTSPGGIGEDSDTHRFRELRTTEGDDFSFLQPLQYWNDIMASGIHPSKVKIIGIGGGTISAAEYRIALALGASVAVVTGSGRAAEELVEDRDWRTSPNLVELSPEAESVEAFVMS
jgi:class 3 adenylate cyclase